MRIIITTINGYIEQLANYNELSEIQISVASAFGKEFLWSSVVSHKTNLVSSLNLIGKNVS